MRWLIYLFSLLITLSMSGEADAQFWKKRKYHKKSTSGKVTKPHGNKQYKDAFARKSKKRANVRTKRKPLLKTKKRMHRHNTGRKTKKPGRKKFYKAKYKKAVGKRSRDRFSRNANRTKRKSKRGGGKSNGIFRGRKR